MARMQRGVYRACLLQQQQQQQQRLGQHRHLLEQQATRPRPPRAADAISQPRLLEGSWHEQCTTTTSWLVARPRSRAVSVKPTATATPTSTPPCARLL